MPADYPVVDRDGWSRPAQNFTGFDFAAKLSIQHVGKFIHDSPVAINIIEGIYFYYEKGKNYVVSNN